MLSSSERKKIDRRASRLLYLLFLHKIICCQQLLELPLRGNTSRSAAHSGEWRSSLKHTLSFHDPFNTN